MLSAFQYSAPQILITCPPWIPEFLFYSLIPSFSASNPCHWVVLWKLTKVEARTLYGLTLFVFLLSGIIILHSLLSSNKKLFLKTVYLPGFLFSERGQIQSLLFHHLQQRKSIFFFLNYVHYPTYSGSLYFYCKSSISKNWENREKLGTTTIP